MPRWRQLTRCLLCKWVALPIVIWRGGPVWMAGIPLPLAGSLSCLLVLTLFVHCLNTLRNCAPDAVSPFEAMRVLNPDPNPSPSQAAVTRLPPPCARVPAGSAIRYCPATSGTYAHG